MPNPFPRTLEEFRAIAARPSPPLDLAKLALIQAETARNAYAEDDAALGRMFLADAILHLKELRTLLGGA